MENNSLTSDKFRGLNNITTLIRRVIQDSRVVGQWGSWKGETYPDGRLADFGVVRCMLR